MSEERDNQQSANEGPVPKAVVNRLSLYLRELQGLLRDGSETTSSTQLGKLLGVTDAQVRKDLAYFGQFGYPGIGYRCDELVQAIKGILGTNRAWPVALVGTGNLGRALLRYRGFGQQGFSIAAAFDAAAANVGTLVEGITIHSMDDLSRIAHERGIKLAILAVPADAAQQVAEAVVAAGIDGILNFAPVTLALPDDVSAVGVDLAIELEQLSFAVVNRRQKT